MGLVGLIAIAVIGVIIVGIILISAYNYIKQGSQRTRAERTLHTELVAEQMTNQANLMNQVT